MGTPHNSLHGTHQGLGTPPLFPPRTSMTATVINHDQGRDRRASTAATGRRIVPSIPESLLEGHRGVLAGRSASGMERASAAVSSHARDSREQKIARTTIEPGLGETGVSQEDDRVQGKTRLTVLSGKRHGY
jgi:hypothetical protein